MHVNNCGCFFAINNVLYAPVCLYGYGA